jgi:hypothetical protein
LAYAKAKDVPKKLSKFLQITGIMSQALKPYNVQKQIRSQICNTLAIPTLLDGSGNWTLKEKDKSRISAAEMKFLIKTTKYTLLTKKGIKPEFKPQPVPEKSTITNINGYNMFAELTDLDSHMLLRNTNRQERGTQTTH